MSHVKGGVDTVVHRYLPWQKEPRNAVLNEGAKILWFPTAARAGKDRFAAMFTDEMSIRLGAEREYNERTFNITPLVPRVNTWIVAPTKALYKQNWEEINEHLPQSLVLRSNRNDGIINLRGGVHFSFKSADDPASLVAEGVDILLFTEASRCRSELVWNESLIPRLMSPERYGLGIINGTPRNGRRHWYRVACENAQKMQKEAAEKGEQSRERCWQYPTWINPLMLDKIEIMRNSMPARLFRSEIAGLWPDEDERPFRESDMFAISVEGGPKPLGPYVVAIDVARFKNWTAATAWDPGAVADDGEYGKPQCIDALGLRDMRTGAQVARLKEFCKKYPGQVIVDCTGAHGATFREYLEDELRQPIHGYDFAGHRKEVLVENYILAVENHQFVFRKDLIPEKFMKEIEDEHEGFECEITDTGAVEYFGEPDDFVISPALGWHLCQSGMGVSRFNHNAYLQRFF